MTQDQTATAMTPDGGRRSRCSATTSTAPSARAARAARSRRGNPATERGDRARSPTGSAADIDDAVAAARRAFDEGPWPRLSASERAAVLRRIASPHPRARRRVHPRRGARHRHADLAGAAASPRARRRTSTTTPASSPSCTAARSRSATSSSTTRSTSRSGVAGPDHALERAADALDLAPRAGARRGQHGRAQARRVVAAVRRRCSPRCSTEPGLPTGVFNVVHGFGETAGAPLSAHPGVNLICFTGEASTGSLRDRRRARRRSSAPRSSSAASRRSSSSRTPIPTSPSTPRWRRSSR